MENLEQKTEGYFRVEVKDILLAGYGYFKYTRRVKSIHNKYLDRIFEDCLANSEEFREGLELLSSIGNRIEARDRGLYIFHIAYVVSLVSGGVASLF